MIEDHTIIPHPSTRAALHLALALALFLTATLSGFASLPLLEPDEGRNAEVAWEMLSAGDWLRPQFHGLPYLDKPLLHFDAVALSFRLLGKTEAAARLPSLLFALLALWATLKLGRATIGTEGAFRGGAVLLTTPLFLGFARTVILDMALTACVTMAVALAEEARARRSRAIWAWVWIGLAVLTKGPVGLILPLLAHFAIGFGRGRRFASPLFQLRGVLLFLAVVGSWVFVMERAHPGFLRYALVTETFERLTQPTFRRAGPAWYYLPVVLGGLLPWSLLAAGSLRGARRHITTASGARGLAVAAWSIVVFFSLSKSKLPGYILPALPLFALSFCGGESSEARATGRARAHLHPVLLSGVLGIALLLAAALEVSLAGLLKLPLSFEPSVERLFLGMGALYLALAALPLLTQAKAATARWIALAVTPLTLLFGQETLAAYAEQNSARQMAAEVQRLGGASARIVCLHCFPNSLDFYLDRVVPVVTTTGREITSTYVERNISDFLEAGVPGLLDGEEWRARLARGEIDMVITRRQDSGPSGFTAGERFGRYRLWTRARGVTPLVGGED